MPVEEFNRITSENKRLTELLFAMYDDMRSRVTDMQSPGNESTVRKRKFEEHYECSSANSSEEIFQRVHENSRTKVSRVYIRVDPSDMSLVSSRHLLQKHKFHLCNSI